MGKHEREGWELDSSGGFRNLKRGVQPLVRESQPKILGCHAYFRSRKHPN